MRIEWVGLVFGFVVFGCFVLFVDSIFPLMAQRRQHRPPVCGSFPGDYKSITRGADNEWIVRPRSRCDNFAASYIVIFSYTPLE